MKIITLVENTTISAEYKNKHGLCFYIETKKHKILFDLGSDNLFLENAKKLGIDIEMIDTVIISHGHKDHGGALEIFLENNKTAKIYIQKSAFLPYYTNVIGLKCYVGLDRTLQDHQRIILIEDAYVIDDELQLFSNVTERCCFSKANKALYIKTEGKFKNDTFQHEQSLIISEKDKKVLFGGCAHNGIVNILNKAKHVCNCELDYVISGFHLYNPVAYKYESEALINQVADILSKKPTQFFTCHCTGKKPFHILKNKMGEQIKYISTGESIVL